MQIKTTRMVLGVTGYTVQIGLVPARARRLRRRSLLCSGQ